MSSKIRVSIIIPFYNRTDLIKKTLASIDEEIPYEVIIVNDGSTKSESIELMKKYRSEGKYKVIDQQNTGSGGARNKGAAYAKGEYLLFLDCDDLLQKNYCTLMAEELDKNPHISFIYPNEILFGTRTGFWDVQEYDSVLIRYYQYFLVTSLMRKSFFEKMQGFDTSFKYLEDREFWVRASTKGFAGKKSQVLHFYRHHKETMTEDVNKNKLMNSIEKSIHNKYKKNYSAKDFLNKKVLFFSLYIKLFYLIPKVFKDYILNKQFNEFLRDNIELVKLFPKEVTDCYIDKYPEVREKLSLD